MISDVINHDKPHLINNPQNHHFDGMVQVYYGLAHINLIYVPATNMSRSGFSGCRSRKFGAVSQVAHANVLWAWIQIRGKNHCKTMQTIDAYQLCASKNAYYIYRNANIHSANMCKSYLLTVSASQTRPTTLGTSQSSSSQLELSASARAETVPCQAWWAPIDSPKLLIGA